jgi:hypothetical protein
MVVETPLYRHVAAARGNLVLFLKILQIVSSFRMARTQSRVVVLDPLGGHNLASQMALAGGGVSSQDAHQVPDHVAPPTHLSLYSALARSKMSVQLHPSNTLGFKSESTGLQRNIGAHDMPQDL